MAFKKKLYGTRLDKIQEEMDNQVQVVEVDGKKVSNTPTVNTSKYVNLAPIKETAKTSTKTSTKKSNKKDLGDNIGFIGKSLSTGILGGFTGILNAGATDLADNLEKGKESRTNFGKIISKILAPGLDSIIDTNKKVINAWKDDDASLLEKIVDTGTASVSGLVDLSMTPINTLAQGMGALMPDDTSKKVLSVNDTISEPYKYAQNELANESQFYGGGTQLIGNTANVIGNMFPGIVAGAVNPALGLATMGTSAKGLSTQEALDKGVKLEEAVDIGNTKGMIEVGTELLTGGINVFGKGALDDIIEAGIDKKVKNEVANFLAQEGAGLLGETAEETISDVLNTLIDKGTVDPDASYSLKDFGDTAVTTILSTAVINALTGGYGGSAYKANKIALNNSTNKDAVIDKELTNRLSAFKQEGKTLTNKEINKIKKEIETDFEKGAISTDTIESALGGDTYNQLQSIREQKSALEQEIQELENKPLSQITVKENERLQAIREELGTIDTSNLETQLKSEMEQKIANDSNLQKSYIEKEKRKESFTYDNKITDAKEKAVYESAAKYFNNTTRSHEFVERVAKISKDKGTNYGFINNEELQTLGHDVEGKQVNGLVRTNKNGEQTVLINVDSPKALETIVGHETTHLLEGTQEYKELQEAIFNYAKEKGDFDTRQKNLNSLYEGIENADIDSELTADLVGDYLFTDTDFINSLSTQKPTMFQKIKELIDDLVVRFTGTKEEKALREVQKKFKEAYKNTQKNINNEVKYSIKEDNNGKYVQVDIDQDIFNGKTTKEQIKIAHDYILTNFREKGLIKNDDNISITRKTANEYTHPKNNLDNKTYSSKLKASTELHNLLEISKYIKSESDDGRHIFAKNGWDYYETVFKVGDKVYSGVLNIANGDKGKLLYDITNIKERASNYSVKTVSVANSLSNNSISFQNEDVNTINNNSMLNNSNNTSKYSLSQQNEAEPTKNPNVTYGEDIKLQEQEVIAPLKEQTNKLTEKLTNNIANDTKMPENQNAEELAPIKTNTTDNKISNIQKTNSEIKNQQNEEIAKVLVDEPATENNRNKRKAAIIMANVLDKGLVFENLSLKNKNRDLMGKWDYILTSQARGQNIIGNGHVEYDNNTKTTKQVSKSLNDIRTEVGNTGHTQEFYEYMYHKHNIDRMSLVSKAQSKIASMKDTIFKEYNTEEILKLANKRITDKTPQETVTLINQAKDFKNALEVKNKPVFGDNITAKESEAIVNKYENDYPEFMDFAQDVYDYLNADRQLLIDSGVISQETADLWSEMYPNYVPIRRVKNTGTAINVPLDTGRTGINAPFKKATGGNSNILPLFDTMAMRTLQTQKATAKNSFGVELKNTLNSTIDNQDTTVDEVIDSIDEQEGLLQESKNGRSPTFTVFENGKKITFEITEDMYDAFKPLSDSSILGKTSGVLSTISNIRRGLLTEYNVIFGLFTNPIKDVQDVLLNSQHPAKTYSKIPESCEQIAKKGYWYQEYLANGGEQNSYFDNQDNTFKTEKKGISNIFPLKIISKLNNFIEMSPRLAEYIASRESGRSIETSMLDAARVTTNFKAGGDLTKFLNRNGATFLNASVQGAMQQVRNFREAQANGIKGWANLATKFAIAGLPALLLNGLLWNDDEEYEELSDYVKQNYYVIGKNEDGTFIRIPKGRTVAIIQEAFNQIGNLITGDDETDLSTFLNLVVSNLAPNNPIENNIFSPITQAVTNTTWYGGDLVPTRLQNMPKAEQYDESTDMFSRWVGETLNVSPYKVNYLLDQYSGGVGDVLLPMMTPEAESDGDSIGDYLLAPLRDKFTTNSTTNNQNISDFYDLKEELTVNANMTNATDEDILKNKYMNSINSELSDLYAEKREVQNSNLSNSKKYEKVMDIQSQINELTKKALSEYNNIKSTSNYSKIGDKEYYKRINSEGEEEWTKVNDEEAKDLKKLGLSVTEKNTYFKTKNEINYITKDYIDDKGDLSLDEDSDEYKEEIEKLSDDKKSDIIDKIKNTGLNDEQKAYLYGKYYSSEKTLEKVTSSGIPFDNFLDYHKDSLSFETTEEKVNYLYKSNITSDAKTVIYETSVLSGFDNEDKYKDYKTAKAAGVDIDSWLSYKKQEFVADKDEKGKSVSGSRKKKIVNYINSLNLSIPQKAILIKQEYTSFDDYNDQIVNHVASLNISYEDKVKIIEGLDMTIGSDGRVYWD